MHIKMVKLRGNPKVDTGLWPIGAIPDNVILNIGMQLVHSLAVGHNNISGDDFGTIFANATGGDHKASPLGVVDVIANGTAWSVKTVQASDPHATKNVRLISGRNSPDYSSGISNPREDATRTGHAVLDIWNARVDQSLKQHNELRIVVLIRNMIKKRFCLFEQQIAKFPADDFEWEFNRNGNLTGFEKSTKLHHFTWQPHGSQFTIIRLVPGSARRFSINREIPPIDPNRILDMIEFDPSWISIA